MNPSLRRVFEFFLIFNIVFASNGFAAKPHLPPCVGYATEQSLIQNQPKAQWADYVEANGGRAPIRYPTLEAALKSGKVFIIRSEMKRELTEAAGMLDSFVITPESLLKDIQTTRSINIYLKDKNLKNFYKRQFYASKYATRYAELVGLKPSQLMKEASFSFWEYIPGYNRMMIADSAIPNRYHLYTTAEHFLNYTIIDQGNIIYSKPHPLSEAMKSDLPNVIAFYDSIHHLDHLKPNNCPAIEFETQMKNDQLIHHFLQVHYTHDFAGATFVLNRAMKQGEVLASFVRGATPPEGIQVNVTLDFDMEDIRAKKPGSYQASYEFYKDVPYREVMSRRVVIHFSSNDIDWMVLKSMGDHILKSENFNPDLSIGIKIENLFPNLEQDLHPDGKKMSKIVYRVRVTSDGRTAYLQNLGVVSTTPFVLPIWVQNMRNLGQ